MGVEMDYQGIGLYPTKDLDPGFVEAISAGVLELVRLHEEMGGYWPAPESEEGITAEARTRAFRQAHEVRKSGAIHQIPMLVQMRKRGQIDKIEEKAGLMFASDFAGAHRVSGLISSLYAKASRPRGSDMLPPSERMTPEERRSFHYGRFMDACRTIGHMPTIEALVMLVCEYAPSSAAEVGERFLPYKQQQQRQAVGVTLVKVGLQRLAQFYGLTT